MTHKVTISLDDDVWMKIQDKEDLSGFFNNLARNEFDFNAAEEKIILEELEHYKKTGECYQLNKVIAKK